MMDKKEKVKEIIKIFDELYRDAQCTLDYENPLQLLISTQLAAQCTDARVNVVTKTLFKKYKDARDFANADLKELEQDIKPTGFYHNKAKNIKETCKIIVENSGQGSRQYGGFADFTGSGKKTANVYLGDAFGIPGIVVDTHAKRLSNRIGLVNTDDPKKIEFELMEIVPKEKWSLFCHQLVYHGRAVCKARKPECDKCAIIDYCDYGKEHLK